MELPDFLIIPGILIKDRELQPLDREVYGIIYWFVGMSRQKCTASNRTIADLLSSNPTSIANSITRLTRKKYITHIMDNQNHRIELIPNITYTPKNVHPTPSSNDDTPSSNDDTPIIKSLTPPSSNDEHNKNILIRKENKNKHNLVEVSPPQAFSKACISYIALFNSLFNTKHQPTKGRDSKIRLRLKVYTHDQIRAALENLSKSAFHTGKNERGWIADPDFIIRSDEMIDKWLNITAKSSLDEKWSLPS